MAQEPSKIKEYIETEREKLGDDLQEIEHRMKDAVDCRVWYEKNTALMLGAAVAGGFLLSTIVGGSSVEQPHQGSVGPAAGGPEWKGEWRGESSSIHQDSRPKSNQLSRIGGVLDNTVAALVGVAAHKLQDYVSQSIPGFKEQYAEAERRRAG